MSKFYSDAATVPLSTTRPLLIVDADEVLLGFARGLDRFLDAQGYYLDLVSYRLHGNVRHRNDNTPLLDIEVTGLLDEFRVELDSLEPVAGSAGVLTALAPALDVVVLSNVTPSQAPARVRNLEALGFRFPLLVNNGAKGPAVKALAKRAGRPIFFMDDIPMHHASVAEAAPEVLRIHFVGDERLKPLMPPSKHAHLWAENWEQAGAFMRANLDEGSD